MKQKRIFYMVCLLGVLLWTACIWGHSMQSAQHSTQESSRVEQVVKPLLDAVEVPDPIRAVLIRKLAHFMEFAILGVLWYLLLSHRHVLLSFGICLATACIDESIQLFVPGRSGQLWDVLLDGAGALFVILLLYSLKQWRQKKKQAV